MSQIVLRGDEYCCDCGVKLTAANARHLVLDAGDPESPWETASRFGEMPLTEQMERASIVALVCATCFAKGRP